MTLLSKIVPALVAGIALARAVAGQSNGDCLSLKNSAQCPSFQDAYINPTNLSNAWPWFSNVVDVSTFDEQFAQYFTDPDRFITTKFGNQLQCNRSAADNTTLQWERTILCGQFSQISYSAQCNVQNRADPIMVCQDTCIQYSDSEHDIVATPQICTPSGLLTPEHFTIRNDTLTKDHVSCTDWTSLVSTNNATCIEGVTNEGNCGYGPGVSTQLCAACDPAGNNTVPTCCFDRKTDLSQCTSYGHPGAAAILPTSSAAPGFASPSATAPSNNSNDNQGAAANRASDGAGLSGGQLAGIIVGCIVGALLIGALLAWLLFARRRRNQDPESSRGLVYGGAGRSSSGSKAWNQSEEGTTRSIGGSPLGEKQPGSAGHGLGTMGAGAGAGALAGAALGGSTQHNEGKERPDSQVSSGTGGSDGRGTTVGQVRDQYTGQDIFPGEEVVAIYPYNASLNDEITLEPDQRVTIMRLYDDGWALGKTQDGQEGALPLVCVSSVKGDVPGRAGAGPNGTTSEEEGMTSGAEYTSSVDGAVTADEGGFTSDATGNRSQRR